MSNAEQAGLSVIIPVYNSEKYLASCLDSIIKQEYENLEIICINDGSTDSSAQILDCYAQKDDRVVVLHNENQGVSASRNCGIDNATKPFITFVDSDDIIEPKMYSEMIKLISQKKLDCVCCNYKKIFSENKNLDIKSRFGNRILYNQEIREEIVKGLVGFSDENINCLTSLWNKIFRLEIINKNKIRLNEKRTHGEDWLFCIEYYASISSIGFLENCYYNYILRNNSLVGKPRNNVLELAIETNIRFRELFPEFDWYSERIVCEENNLPIKTALYYRETFRGQQREELLKKVYYICKEENYYDKNMGLNTAQKRLKNKLDNNDASGFVRCLKIITSKDYIFYRIKQSVKMLLKR